MRTSPLLFAATWAFWIPSLLAETPVAPTSPKRGLCYVQGEDPADDRTWDGAESGLTWYYNYQANPIQGIDSKLQFVPMLWDHKSAGDNPGAFYKTVKRLIDSGRTIEYALGFNEPDGCKDGGSCISPETAAEAWIAEMEPLRKDLDIKLGAPAVTGSPRGLQWLQDFYAACDGACNTDFMPVHWYGNFEGFASWVGQINATYQNMSMWATEVGFAHQDINTTQEFFNQSVSFLDDLDYVTHYSWFGAFRSDVSNVGANGALLTEDGELTDIGAYYMGGAAAGNVPSGAAKVAVFAGWSVGVVASLFWSFA